MISAAPNGDGVYTQHAETLSAFRAIEVFDAAVIDDFGDGYGPYGSVTNSDLGSDGYRPPSMTRIGDGGMEMGRRLTVEER